MAQEGDLKFQKVQDHLKKLVLTEFDYKNILQDMLQAMRKGLTKEGHKSSSIKMYPSYVVKVPNGTETGTYLALDLGGTNYRVILAKMPGEKKPPIIEERTHAIPIEKMTGSGADLFGFIANTLHAFLKSHSLLSEKIKLGFTFSFPCEQMSLNESFLVRWTKGFAANDVIGKNICQLLQEAIDELNLKVECIAVVNDTVGTLTACALEDPNCAVGLIIGTGTNAAYPEKIKNIETLSEKDTAGSKQDEMMIINTEWGAFGENGELKPYLTPWDMELDKSSLHPGEHLYEKMSSGSYIGEIARLILNDLIKEKLLFSGKLPESLKKPNGFLTKYITEAERDPPHLYYSTQYMLSEDLKVPMAEPVDYKIVRYVCEVISNRAAFLIGTGIAALLHKLDRPNVTVGIDGSLYKFHPKFRERLTEIVHQLKPTHTYFHLRLSEDGSGKGAAAIVAAASR